jgi:hypothetical protein
MYKYLIKDVNAGETPNYYNAIGYAPEAIFSEYLKKVGELFPMQFWVAAMPGFMTVFHTCEVVGISTIGRWPFRKKVLQIKTRSLEQSVQGPSKADPHPCSINAAVSSNHC